MASTEELLDQMVRLQALQIKTGDAKSGRSHSRNEQSRDRAV